MTEVTSITEPWSVDGRSMQEHMAEIVARWDDPVELAYSVFTLCAAHLLAGPMDDHTRLWLGARAQEALKRLNVLAPLDPVQRGVQGGAS